MKSTNHPSETQLALYAGNDLGFWEQRQVRRHVGQCARCGDEIRALRASLRSLPHLPGELRADVNWERLSEEMTGNIRVGLAAGECIAGFERAFHPRRPRLVLHASLVTACATLITLVTLWINLPKEQMAHLTAAVGQVRWERIGMSFHRPAVSQDEVILEANPISIEVKNNDHTFSMMHPHAEKGATVSLNTQDSAGVRYVDADTGQVVNNRVYYAQ